MDETQAIDNDWNKVLADYMVRVDRGEKVDREAFVAAHPDFAPQLREYFANSDALAQMADPATHAPSGTLALPCVLGDYELMEQLGAGGMGAVYKARHTRLARTVAVKVLAKDRMARPDAVARFQREMRAVGTLDHPNIVRAHDAREVSGTHILVMECVEGMDLDQVVRRLGPLPIADACEVVRQAALALEHVHRNGLVHRDIKPSNLMLNDEGVVKVLDLGLARLREDLSGDGGLTGDSQMMGTADYMAPEQAADTHSADIRADIYSLGSTLYRLLSGLPPFPPPQYNTVAKKIIGHARDAAMPVRECRPEVPEELAAYLERMLAKEASGAERGQNYFLASRIDVCTNK